MLASIKWPTPFHFEFDGDLDKFEYEACLAIFGDGHEILGSLLRFSPEDDLIEMRKHRDSPRQRFRLSEINEVRLVHPLHLKAHSTVLETHGEEVIQPSTKQSFSVTFHNGKRLTGETVGFVHDKHGLYLFIVNEADTVIRYFLPAHAIENYHIGAALGQMLIDENIATEQDIEAGLEQQQKLRNQRIGDYLTEDHIVNPDELSKVLKRQQSGGNVKLGEALVSENLITEEQLQEALAKQRNDRKKALGEILVSMGVVDKDMIKRMLAKKLGIPFVNVRKFNVDPNAIMLVPYAFVQKHNIMPLYRTDKTLVVATENPMIWEPLDQLRFLTNLNIEPVMALQEDILHVVSQLYAAKPSEQGIEQLASELITADDHEESTEEAVAESDNTLVKLVNKMIIDAYTQGASDIHLESYPGRRGTRVRFRRDGTLLDYYEFPPNFRNALISRIKIMAQLDISEKRRPQDGKIEFRQSGKDKIELRVATVPTSQGLEDVVMRVLAAAKPIPIDQLGLAPDSLDKIKQLVVKPYGLFLICGPTGSGKTTTLHSVLGFINVPDRKIWTAEDPIEITQDGLRQVQVNSKIGWTFAAAMRSFLRADPDVIMVGEMRDAETTKTGIEASLTGHMVFSTLHTNSAPESMVRLLDLGVDPFNFSDALLGILAQRLAKRLCTSCRKTYMPPDREIQELLEEYCLNTRLDPKMVFQDWRRSYLNSRGEFSLSAPKGCPECSHTGYRGRIGLHECLVATPQIKKLIQQRATVEEIVAVAMSEGMRSLKQDGIQKILQGHTDIHQIRAVCS